MTAHLYICFTKSARPIWVGISHLHSSCIPGDVSTISADTAILLIVVVAPFCPLRCLLVVKKGEEEEEKELQRPTRLRCCTFTPSVVVSIILGFARATTTILFFVCFYCECVRSTTEVVKHKSSKDFYFHDSKKERRENVVFKWRLRSREGACFFVIPKYKQFLYIKAIEAIEG